MEMFLQLVHYWGWKVSGPPGMASSSPQYEILVWLVGPYLSAQLIKIVRGPGSKVIAIRPELQCQVVVGGRVRVY